MSAVDDDVKKEVECRGSESRKELMLGNVAGGQRL